MAIAEEQKAAALEAFTEALESAPTAPPELDEETEAVIILNLSNALETLTGLLDPKKDAMLLASLKCRIQRILRRDKPEAT